MSNTVFMCMHCGQIKCINENIKCSFFDSYFWLRFFWQLGLNIDGW
uniref:Uncharacterized protein n=1 Tax=Anguilla anguilla TaxID=7936 RepID=A0A0E9S1Y2_ANGAN